MQLVNLDTPQNIISKDLISAIQSNQRSKAENILESIKDINVIFKSFYILGSRQINIDDHLSSALIYTDAVIELFKRLFPDDPRKLLRGTLDYYCSLEYAEKDESLAEIKPNVEANAVMVSELEEYVLQMDLKKALQMTKNLLMVVDSKKYFNELLLEIAAKIFTMTGESIIVTNVVRKGIELFQCRAVDELIVFLLKFLTSQELISAKQNINPSEEEIKYAEYVLRAANNPGDHGRNLLFMVQARQVYRYASAKYKEIWGYLAASIENKLSDSSVPELEEISPVKGGIYDFQRSLNVSEVQLTMALTNTLLQNESTSNELFYNITLFMLEKELFKYPEKIIYLNVARRLAAALDYPRNLHIFKTFLHYIFTTESKMN